MQNTPFPEPSSGSLIRVGAVSYLNTKPLIYGLQQEPMASRIALSTGYPSQVAAALAANDIDLGLIPVAAIADLKDYYIDADYCIGAVGPVASVCLFSQVPLQQIRRVWLDYQSRTSVALVQILFREYWQQEPEFLPAYPGYEEAVADRTAAVIIGDRALELRHQFPFVYDLAEAWIAHTRLPFVFAAWVANKELPETFIEQFNEANAVGLHQLRAIADAYPIAGYDTYTYYTQNISYSFDERKRLGLHRFLTSWENLKEGGLIHAKGEETFKSMR